MTNFMVLTVNSS